MRGSLLAAVVMLVMSCSEPQPLSWPDLGPEWPDRGWAPVYIDPTALDPGPGAVIGHDDPPSFSREERIRDALAAGDAIEHHYSQARIFPAYEQSSAGVRIVYLQDDDLFYLQEDHMMGHYDAFIGPFRGDPRRVLADLAP